MIYINEAHASDIWNIGLSAGTVNHSHKNLDDRIGCIKKFIDTFNISFPVFADSINSIESFENVFAAWPFRFYVCEYNVVKIIGQPNDSTFSLDQIFDLVNGA
jgi:hypothetical protein